MKRMVAATLVGLAVLIGAILLIHGRSQAPNPVLKQTKSAPVLAPSAFGESGDVGAAASVSTTPNGKTAKPETAVHDVQGTQTAPAAKLVSFKAAQVLARVNGVAITGKDLVPFGSSDPNATQSMSPEAYRYLLDQAIERELTFQEANREGVALTTSQNQQLNGIASMMQSREAQQAQEGVVAHLNRTGTLQDEINYQVNDTSAAMLLNSMMNNAGMQPKYPTSTQVQDYYQAHIDQYGALPTDPNERAAAWNQIYNEISALLSPSTLQEYLAERQQFLQMLKGSANIVTMSPNS